MGSTHRQVSLSILQLLLSGRTLMCAGSDACSNVAEEAVAIVQRSAKVLHGVKIGRCENPKGAPNILIRGTAEALSAMPADELGREEEDAYSNVQGPSSALQHALSGRLDVFEGIGTAHSNDDRGLSVCELTRRGVGRCNSLFLHRIIIRVRNGLAFIPATLEKATVNG
jgi:hypothetical protein